MGIDLILLIIAFVLFLIAAFFGQYMPPRINLVALGLALVTLTMITS